MAGPDVWTVREERLLHDGSPWLRLYSQTVALPDGRLVDRYYRIAMRDFAIAYVTTTAGDVLVLRLYRHGRGQVGLALPGGLIDDGEEPLAAAQRELLEETGYRAKNWRSLGSFTMNSNYGCGTCHAFTAEGAEPVTDPDSGDLEEADLVTMAPADLLAALRNDEVGIIGHAAVIALAQLEQSGLS